MTALRHEVLQRLLLGKNLLVGKSGQLTQHSTPVAVAQVILTAHDAAELVLAAVAHQLQVQNLPDQAYFMDYAARVRSHDTETTFPGYDFFRQLNLVRKNFKHEGILPERTQWYNVIDRTWDWLNQVCQTYLNSNLDQLDLETLLPDEIRKHIQDAKRLQGEEKFREALEELAKALFILLGGIPGVYSPVVGKKNSHHALMLLAFGVRPSEFLSLQEFLPEIRKNKDTGDLEARWDERHTGHPGHWTERNVRFCLSVLLDVALKVQNATWHPSPITFEVIFDDVITAKEDGVELWVEKRVGEQSLLFSGKVEKVTVKTLSKGESLRGRLNLSARSGLQALAGKFLEEPSDEQGKTVSFSSEEVPSSPFTILYVEIDKVDISKAPRENKFVREYFPHLF